MNYQYYMEELSTKYNIWIVSIEKAFSENWNIRHGYLEKGFDKEIEAIMVRQDIFKRSYAFRRVRS